MDLPDKQNHNTHRSLRQLVAVEAWFARSQENERRFTLHAGVTFDEERLGGGGDSAVTFKLSIKKCEFVFLPPSSGYFDVDPASVRSPKPQNPHAVQTTQSTNKNLGLGGRVGLAGVNSDVSAHAEAGFGRESNTTVTSNQVVSAFHELSKRSREGHRAWSIDGKSLPKERLWGSIWDAHEEPRLMIVDRRPSTVAQKDDEMGFPPISRIEIRCLRADIDIYDITFKNAADQAWFKTGSSQAAKLKAAEAFLRQAILGEGLLVGDLSDRFSELTICDVTIPIHDQSALDR